MVKEYGMIGPNGQQFTWTDKSLQEIASIFSKRPDVKNEFQLRLEELDSLIPKDKFENLLKWTLFVRQNVGGRPNYLQYLKFWHTIYLDTHPWIQLLIARQMWKSNYLMSRLAYKMTKKPSSTVLYGTYEIPSLTKFSKKFRNQLWSASPILRKFIKGSTIGNASSVELITESIAWLITHLGGFTHAEGESTDEQDWDEAQYLDWDNYVKAEQAQSFTDGDFCTVGIGGDEDSAYHEMWKQTDQREWHYENEDVYVDTAGKEWIGQGWRKNLQYDENGLVWGSYMNEALDGTWQITKPENSVKHGYHLSQYMAPWIPLSKSDATKLYKKLPSKSIEGILSNPNITHADVIKHVEAGFVRGESVPFPRQPLYDLCVSNLSMLHPKDVDYELGDLYGGWDWGGGGRTIGWIYQVTNVEIPVYRLINAEKVETNDVEEQFNHAASWIDDYSLKKAVVDAGGGTSQVQKLEKEFGSRCVKFSYLKRPGHPTAKNIDEERLWRKENRWMYDKTWLMERVKDYINRPYMDGTMPIRKIVWPGADMEKIDWIVEQFKNETTEKIKLDSGGYYTRYFTPDKDRKPDDALQANNFSIVASDLGRKGNNKIEFTQLTPKNDPFGDGYGN